MNTVARLVVAALLLFCSATGHTLDKVTFLTNWYAEAEHGGFYQAVAEGIYERYGLDVKIGMGGPQVNVYQLLLAEKADFVMGYDVATINAVEQGLPLITVAAPVRVLVVCVFHSGWSVVGASAPTASHHASYSGPPPLRAGAVEKV